MTPRAKLAINNTVLFLWRPAPIFNCSLHNIGIISIGKSRRNSPLVKYALLSLVHCPSLSHYSSLYCSTKSYCCLGFSPVWGKNSFLFMLWRGGVTIEWPLKAIRLALWPKMAQNGPKRPETAQNGLKEKLLLFRIFPVWVKNSFFFMLWRDGVTIEWPLKAIRLALWPKTAQNGLNWPSLKSYF